MRIAFFVVTFSWCSLAASISASLEEGKALFQSMACFTCHGQGSDREGKLGPALGGVFGSMRTFENGETSKADEAYLRESIEQPAKRLVKGYHLGEGAMPPYGSLLDESQVDSLVLYLKTLKASDKKSKKIMPFRDPPDQPFRRAPTAWSSRTIAIPLGEGLHWAFDQHLLRTIAVWEGPSLNLHGPPYTSRKNPFVCEIEGKVLWSTPPFVPWKTGPGLKMKSTPIQRFSGIRTTNGKVALQYWINDRFRVTESASAHRMAELPVVVRRFSLGPVFDKETSFLAHVLRGDDVRVISQDEGSVLLRSGQERLLVCHRLVSGCEWDIRQELTEYEEAIITNENTEKSQDPLVRKENLTFIRIKFPQMVSKATPFEIATLTSNRPLPESLSQEAVFGREKTGMGTSSPLTIEVSDEAKVSPDSGDAYYRIENFPLPAKLDLLVGGMDFDKNGDLAIATWSRGEVYILENVHGSVDQVRFRRYARGLMEPLGLRNVHGHLYVTQKSELTRLHDLDANGESDWQECITDDWGFSGNYHSYAFGPVPMSPSWDLGVFLCGRRGRWDLPYVGWAVKIDAAKRTLEGYASGLRAPNGFGIFGKERDVFVADNQGDWVGACKLIHVRKGAFYGYPSGKPDPEKLYQKPRESHPPAVWLPYELSQSASDLVEITTDEFGPFKGQMLVGDFQHGTVQRVCLEKVDGEWQGAVWPFLTGFNGAVNRLVMSPDGRLYAGGCRRTWGASKPAEYSLDRVSFTGKVPFEVERVIALKDGFQFVFTQPVDGATAGKASSYQVSQFRYNYHKTYGSPRHDHEGKAEAMSPIAVASVTVGLDRQSVVLSLTGLREGFVTEISADGVRSAGGDGLRHPMCHYTLNQMPDL